MNSLQIFQLSQFVPESLDFESFLPTFQSNAISFDETELYEQM